MQLVDAVSEVAGQFDYEADRLRLFDSWHVLTEQQGRYRGDCEDFALTVFWRLADGNIWKFLWNVLITHQYRIYRVRDRNGDSHAVGCFRDQWFDNWTLATKDRDEFFSHTGHTLLHIYPGPLIALYLLIGLFSN